MLETKFDIASNWLPRYTGTEVNDFGDYILLTNFNNYVYKFAEIYDCEVKGIGKPMQTATNADGITIVNFGIGSANAATIMDLLVARKPQGVLFLGKCGGLKKSTDLGHFILPTAAIRGEGTSNDYLPTEVPALPSFNLHKYVSDKITQYGHEYRTGVVHTTNRRVWEWDQEFKDYLKKLGVIGIDMETATLFLVGYVNQIARGALLLVSDLPMIPEGIKTDESDKLVTKNFIELHLKIGIESLLDISKDQKQLKHLIY